MESAGTWLNVGVVYIAGALRAAGYEVDYYDAMSLWHKWPEIHHSFLAGQMKAAMRDGEEDAGRGQAAAAYRRGAWPRHAPRSGADSMKIG